MNGVLTRRAPRWLLIAVSLVLLAALLVGVGPTIVIYRDWAFICEYTGSRQGYRQWLPGTKTHQWYRASPIETTMRQSFPNELEHKWTSYAGTGYNLFGVRMLYGHGRPGAVFRLSSDMLERYTANLEPRKIKSLYDLLRFGSAEAKAAEVKRIQELWLSQ